MPSKTFCDPIHQHIKLPELCVRIVDTPQFQRLRFIRQLGNAFFVYPGATHSRFEHSLGVCHLAGKLAKQLLSEDNEWILTKREQEKYILAIQLAGLCHDLGHGPKSHTFEHFVNTNRKDWTHEKASEQLLDHIIEHNDLRKFFEAEFGTGQEIAYFINFIKECIRGKKREGTESDLQKGKWFLYEIVANKETEIDVDKWDYFLRDCHMTGVRHTFDNIRAIETAGVVKDADGCTHIGWRDKEAYNLYEMFHTRARLHRLVYQHRVTAIIDVMEGRALRLANNALKYYDSEGKSYTLEETVDNMEVYSLTDDDVFTTILKLEPKGNDVIEAQKIIRNILQRQIPELIAEKNVKYNKDKKTEYEQHLKPRIVEECGLQGEDEEKITVIVAKFTYCKGDKDPVAECVKFFTKNDTSPKTLKKDEVSLLLPGTFAELQVRLHCDHTLLSQKERLEEAFMKILKEW